MPNWRAAWPRAFKAWIAGLVALSLAIAGYPLVKDFIESSVSRPVYEHLFMFPVIYLLMLFQISVSMLPTAPFGVAALVLIGSTAGFRRLVFLVILIGSASLASVYLFDYGIPNYRLYSDDRPDWEHGLTSTRYLIALSAQSFVFLVGLILSKYAPLRSNRHSN